MVGVRVLVLMYKWVVRYMFGDFKNCLFVILLGIFDLFIDFL